MPPVDYSADVRPHRSRLLRTLLLGGGFLAVGLGVVGVFLPVLPTTPFMLIAAACFARASSRFYNWLLNTRLFGPTIVEWRRTRTIPLRTKLATIVLIVLLLGSSIVFFVPYPAGKIVLGLIGLSVIVFLLRIPSRPPVPATVAAEQDASA